MRGLYPIVDLDALATRKISPVRFAESVLSAKPPLLQVRAKGRSPRETLAVLRAIAPLCRAHGALLFANDRADLARLAGADGVHVGQDDLPVSVVRRIAPELRIGISTHNLEQLESALQTEPDYVAFGPVFTTASKANPDPVVGLQALARAASRARAAGTPLVAIGGIELSRAADLASHGVIGAVIGALLDDSTTAVAARARALHMALGGITVAASS